MARGIVRIGAHKFAPVVAPTPGYLGLCAHPAPLIRFDGFGPKRLDLCSEQGVLQLGQGRIIAQNRFGFELRSVEQAGIGELGDCEVGGATLACAKKFTRAS